MDIEKSDRNIIALTADVVAAYVSNNAVPKDQLGDLIKDVHSSLNKVGVVPSPEEPERLTPAINPKRSVTPDYIVCLDDGKRFKSLKRHLTTTYNITPDQYRAKWNLPRDYPMVAPNYAAQRSQLAKASGLGRRAGARKGKKKA